MHPDRILAGFLYATEKFSLETSLKNILIFFCIFQSDKRALAVHTMAALVALYSQKR